MKRRELVWLGAAAVGLGLGGCSQGTTRVPAAPPTSAPTRTETIGVIIDPVVYQTLKDAVAATDAVLVGTMGPLATLTTPNPTDAKYEGVPPSMFCEAVVTVKRVILDRRANPTPFTQCRMKFFGGEVDGVRHVAAQDPLPTVGQDYFLLLLANSADTQHAGPSREGVPDMVSIMLGDGRWRVGGDGLLSPEPEYHPTMAYFSDAFAHRTVDQAAAAVLAVS